jgi:hypothetical protein
MGCFLFGWRRCVVRLTDFTYVREYPPPRFDRCTAISVVHRQADGGRRQAVLQRPLRMDSCGLRNRQKQFAGDGSEQPGRDRSDWSATSRRQSGLVLDGGCASMRTRRSCALDLMTSRKRSAEKRRAGWQCAEQRAGDGLQRLADVEVRTGLAGHRWRADRRRYLGR